MIVETKNVPPSLETSDIAYLEYTAPMALYGDQSYICRYEILKYQWFYVMLTTDDKAHI